MKTWILGFLGASLLATTAFADTKGKPMGIMPMPSVRHQIYTQAKQEGALKGMSRPSMQLTQHGNTVTATIYSMGRGWNPQKDTRLAQKTATFKVTQTSEGKLATPTVEGGQTWHQIFYMNAVK